MSNDIGIGEIIVGKRERDAIHVAVVPITAPQDLEPCTHVNELGQPAGYRSLGSVGIVDPYLRKTVKKGEQFYLFLYPGTITSLRHEWTHPKFKVSPVPGSEEVSASVVWLHQFCKETNISYNELLKEIQEGHVCFGDDDGPYHVNEEMWYHVEVVLGRGFTIPEREDVTFRCAC